MKKPVIAIISVLAAAAFIAGAVIGITAWKKAAVKVKVFPASYVVTSYYGDGFSSGGMVSTDVSQNVYLADTDIVKTVFVTQGQQVSVGDPLVEYDTALASLKLQIKELEIQSLQNKYSDALAELDRVSKLKAGQRKTASAPFSGMTHTDTALLSSLDDTNTDAYYTGDGSSGAPFTYLLTSGAKITSRYMLAMSLKAQTDLTTYYTLFEVRQGNTREGALLYSWSMVFAADGNFSFTIMNTPKPPSTPTPEPSADSTPTPSADATPTPSSGATTDPSATQTPGADPSASLEPEAPFPPYYPPVERYTQEEIDQLIREQKAAVMQAELDIKTATLERQNLRNKLDSAVVKAQINGVVKTLAEEADARMNATPFISVTGGNGYMITGTVNESSLPMVTVGTVFMVQSWESGVSATARVTSVSEYPGFVDTGSSLPSSQYAFTAYIEDDVSLRNGEYVEMTLAEHGAWDSAWYLQRMFIREDENGTSYVMIRGKDGKLRKQTVVTGKMVYGFYLEIKSGMSQDDYIAFPYGKDVKEGMNTEIDDSGDLSWLYQ